MLSGLPTHDSPNQPLPSGEAKQHDEAGCDDIKVLPAGMEFPYDFGLVPSTRAGDGDPLDALVLMDEPAFPGCRLSCRPAGIIEGEEGDKKDAERNDRTSRQVRSAEPRRSC